MDALKRSVETFFSKAWEAIGERVGEKLLDYGLDAVGSVKDLKSTLKKLERSSRSLSAKASDVEEHIKNAERSGKKKRKREVELWLEEVKTIEREFHALADEVQTQGFFRRFLGGDRAVELDRVQDLVEESRHFGELVLDDFKPKEVKFLTKKLVGEAFQKNVENIWRLMVTDKIPSIGIYGMGGVGKTTLAKHFNNRLLEENQGCVIWVVVSQEDSIQRLQDEMARLLKVDLSDERDEDKRAASLNGALSQRKDYIIVFDDVWKSICLEKLGDPLRVEGCRLVITTRSSEVCHQIGCGEVIGVNTLQENEAWELFRETLGPETALAPEVEEIAKLVVKECDGLPLGIITLAGSMRRVTAAHSWRNVLEELAQSSMEERYEMEDNVFKVLKYSFDRLLRGDAKSGYTKVQRCFLYCSLYPEDYPILREELIRNFILEELVGKRNTRRAQLDQAHAILDKLVNVCLLESIPESTMFHTVPRVKMHDLFRDMALKLTRGKTKALTGQYLMDVPKEWPRDLEMMSLMRSSIREIQSEASPNCPKLSTLLLCRNMDLGSIEDSFFTLMRGLCILDLSETVIRKLPNSVSDLVSLKALLLQECRYLEYVPDLRKLRSLRELDLTYTNIVEVPQGMEELVNLHWLSLYGVRNLKLQRGIVVSKLINLQCIFLPEGIDAPIEEIERLGQLEQFGGRVKDVSDFNRLIKFIRNQLDRKGVAISYNIRVGEALIDGPYIDTGTRVNNIVDLCGSWNPIDEMIMLGDIRHLALFSCKGLRRGSLSDNIHFNNWGSSLEILHVSKCKGIVCILTNKQLVEDTTASSESPLFRNLERIWLRDLPDFVGIIDQVEILASSSSPPPPSSTPGRQAPAVQFSSLKELSIHNCKKMKKLGLRLLDDQLPNLEVLSVRTCDEIEVIIELEEEESRYGQQLQLVTLPKLEKLDLYNNPRLKSICKSPTLLKCPSIEAIHLQHCHSFERRLPLHFPASLGDNGEPPHYSPPSPALRTIRILENQREWWESLEWEHPSHPQLLQPFIRFD